jgi:hypothetical protein
MGMKVRLRPLDGGTFHCPRCGADRRYQRLEARRWFTIFFIPIIPLKQLGTVVQCESCSSQFDERVLAAPTSADFATGLVTAMRATVAAFLALRDAPRSVAAATDAVRTSGMPGFGDADLTWDRQTGAATKARDAVSAIGTGLEPMGREHFLTTALRVPLADGPLASDAVELAQQVGAWLGMTRANVDGVIAQIRADQAR